MLASFVKAILDLKAQDVNSTLTKYGNYSDNDFQVKFNEKTGNYYLPQADKIQRSVSTIESLIDATIEESKRRDNKTGLYMTASFNEAGGYLALDDNFGAGQYKFERQLSSQWQILNKYLDQNLNHETLLYVIQALKPSIGDQFENLYNAFLEIKFIGEMTVNSKPILTPGKEAGEEYKVKYTLIDPNQNLNNQTGELFLPPAFALHMQYTKGSSYSLDFTIEILITLDEYKKPRFKLIFPEKEAKVEEAIFHEVACFKAAVKESGMTELLILEDY